MVVNRESNPALAGQPCFTVISLLQRGGIRCSNGRTRLQRTGRVVPLACEPVPSEADLLAP